MDNEQPDTSRANGCAARPQLFKKGRIATQDPGDRGPPVPRLLRDMRRVYEQDESKDRGPQKALRKLLNDKPNSFLVQMAGLEKAHLAAQTKEPTHLPEPEPEQRDEGTQRSQVLIAKLIAEAREHAFGDDELTARPGSAQFAAIQQGQLAGALEREQLLLQRLKELEQRPR
jgi:hypothetical protein